MENGGGDWRFLLCLSGDDPEMPTNVWLMGSVFRTRRQDYVYNNCLPDSQTMRKEAAVSFRKHGARWSWVIFRKSCVQKIKDAWWHLLRRPSIKGSFTQNWNFTHMLLTLCRWRYLASWSYMEGNNSTQCQCNGSPQ